jgi:hypothetical protein
MVKIIGLPFLLICLSFMVYGITDQDMWIIILYKD